MDSFDPAVIRKIIYAGGATELNRMLLGISRYCVSGITHRDVPSKNVQLLTTLAIHYLEFVARHGLGVEKALEPKGYYRKSHESEFEEWLKRGAPGLIWEDVLEYLKENPIA